MSATLTQLRTDTRNRLNENTARLWTDAELTRWINEALRDISRRTETIQHFHDAIPIAANVGKYDLPDDVIRIHRVEFVPSGGTNIYPVKASTYQEMDQYWGTNQASTRSYPDFYVLWGFPPNLKVQLYPVPSSAGSLRVFYYRLPATLTNDGDIAEIPEGWHDLVPLYCEYIARRKDRDATWTDAKDLYEFTLSNMIDVTRQWHDQTRSIMVGPSAMPSWLYEFED